ncbi:MAG TPA: ABC transporter substrate-binding protein [Stellaceae bacterium]|nr:ABC transporter substrate-binding protein [Stellaceae bacterium]
MGSSSRWWRASVAMLVLLAAAPSAARAEEAYDLHVVLPITGGGSFVGKGQQDSLQALEASANKGGGIGGRPLHFVFHDDQTSPQVAVQLVNSIRAANPAVILGSSLVAMCNAMAPILKNGPVLYCLSPGFHPAAGGYAFSASSSSYDQIAALVRYYRLKGWTRLAALSGTDATGQDADRAIEQILAMPENAGVKIVEHQHFNPTDVSVAAQMERIKGSGAQALIAWSTGAPVATVFKGAIQAGLDIPIAPSSGNQTFAQMAQYADFLPKQFVVPSALFPEHQGVLQLDPRMEALQQEMYAILRERNLRADNMVATSWDAGLIVVAGLRKLGPGATAEQLRDYIAGLTDFPGVDGIYDFKRYPERGLGPDSSAIMRFDVEGKRWVWLSKPGGAPLAP